uniref:Protein FAM228B isoform X2 n=1 Tax=Geotrypetes seraphini TaxID=260995 RepID=A0A6P8R3S1_GEOSA|nr:protein FAM228B isoform X2 [Geotrypetes seraphini]
MICTQLSRLSNLWTLLKLEKHQCHYTKKSARKTHSSAVPRKASYSYPLFKSVYASFLKSKTSKEWLANKPLTALEELENKERKEFNRASQMVLDTENYFVKEFDKYLIHREFVELRKKEMNYRKWSQRVSEPLLQAIEDIVDSKSNEEIGQRRCLQLEHYLNYCNKKGHVFLEVYNPLEYDPFCLYNLCCQNDKVSTPYLHDPLLREIEENINEEKVVLLCLKGKMYSNKEIDKLHKPKLPLVPLGRKHVFATDWLRTTSIFIENEAQRTGRRRMSSSSTRGILDFKTWTETKYTPELVNEEMQICRKRKFLKRYSGHTPPVNQVTINRAAVLAAT